MAYTQNLDPRRRAVSIGTVTAIHLALGAAFVIGLAPELFVTPEGGGITTRFVPPKVEPAPPPPATTEDVVVTTLALSAPIPKLAVPTTDRPNAIPTTDAPTTLVTTGPSMGPTGSGEWTAPPAPPPIPVTTPKPLAKAEPVRLATPPALRDIGFGNEAYPDAARRAGEQGVTTVALTIGASGRATGCEVTRSSGSYSLDEAACRLVKRNSRFTAAKDTAGRAVDRRLTLPITSRLPR